MAKSRWRKSRACGAPSLAAAYAREGSRQREGRRSDRRQWMTPSRGY